MCVHVRVGCWLNEHTVGIVVKGSQEETHHVWAMGFPNFETNS